MSRRRCYYSGKTLLDDLHEIGQRVLAKHLGDQAAAASLEIVVEFRDELAGVFTQIPSGAECLTAARDAEVEAAFRGDNLDAVAAEFGLSPSTVRAILRRRRSFAPQQ
jgi:Mor family transcriptional regulator